jgi:N-acetylneuraminic acid mutarotase
MGNIIDLAQASQILNTTYTAIRGTSRIFSTSISSTLVSISDYSTTALRYRGGHASCIAGGKLYVFGGSSVGVYFNDISVYDLTLHTWQTLSPTGTPPSTRADMAYGFDSVTNILYIFGGWNGTTHFGDTFSYNIGTNTWTTLQITGAPTARKGSCGSVSGGFFYVLGGDNGTNSLNTNSKYSIAGDSWNDLTNIPAPLRTNAACVIYLGILYMFGGKNTAGTAQNTFSAYNIAGNSWSVIGTAGKPTARIYHSMTVLSGIIYVYSGSNVSTGLALGELWSYNVATPAWTNLTATSTIPDARMASTFLINGTSPVIYGGYGKYGPVQHSYNDVWSGSISTFTQLPGGQIWVRGASFVYLGITFTVSLVGGKIVMTNAPGIAVPKGTQTIINNLRVQNG